MDEVHCLSEWGHDFRTSYLNLAKTIDKLSPKDENGEGKIKFIGLTATASVNVLKDIKIEFPQIANRLNFRIVGGGADMHELKKLAVELGIDHLTHFTGAVSHEEVPAELNRLDIYVALSRQESFGVAVVEAQAMGVPVVVSNVGGLPEVVKNGQTGFIVESENPQQAADMMKKLIVDMELRNSMSVEARQFVHSHFSWPSCAKKMSQVYQNTLKIFKVR